MRSTEPPTISLGYSQTSATLRGEARLVDVTGDLGDAATAEGLIPAVRGMLGHIDVLVATTPTAVMPSAWTI